jgi:hypothetical protein
MQRKTRFFFILLAVFGLALTFSWQGRAAANPPPPRHNPRCSVACRASSSWIPAWRT